MSEDSLPVRAKARIARMNETAEQLTRMLGLPPESKYEVLGLLSPTAASEVHEVPTVSTETLAEIGPSSATDPLGTLRASIRQRVEQHLAALQHGAVETGEVIVAALEMLVNPRPWWVTLQPGLSRSGGTQQESGNQQAREPLDTLLDVSRSADAPAIVLGGWSPEERSQQIQLYLRLDQHGAGWRATIEALEPGSDQESFTHPWHVRVLVGDEPLVGHFESADRWVADRPLSGVEAAQLQIVVSLG